MKYFVIVLAVVALIVGVFAVLVLFGKPTSEVAPVVEEMATEGIGTTDKEPITGSDTLMVLQAMNQDLECQIMYTANDGKEIEGTYFVSGGKVRGDFVVPAPEFGGEIVSSVIVDDPITYVWSTIGEDTYGFKSDKNTPPKDGRVNSNEPVPLDEPVKYSCVKWDEVDASIFIPPATVTFKDLSSVIEAGMEFPEY